jgi:drug/metabolite transporter (DMT)-like permease
MMPNPGRARAGSIALGLFIVFLWATSWVLIKIGLHEIPALTFAGLRYTLASVCLLPLAVILQRRPGATRLTRAALGRLILLGLMLYTVAQGAMFLALAYLPAVTVNLLWSFSTVTVALLGIGLLAERPSGFQWFGVALAAAGAVVYFHPAGLRQPHPVGLIVSVFGVLANAGATVFGRGLNRTRDTHPVVITAVSMSVGSVALLLTGILVQGLPAFSAQGWAIIAWLAVVNTAFTFTAWNYTLRHLSATESSIINGTMMIWIPILAVLFLEESLSPREIAGLLAAAAGTLVVQLRSPAALVRALHHRATE